MRPPIIIAGDDLEVFESVEDAQRYIEAPEVHKGQTLAYDSEGRLLELRAPGQQSGRLLGIRTYSVSSPITISETESDPSHQSELAAHLRSFLRRADVAEEELDNAPLAELVRLVVERRRFTR